MRRGIVLYGLFRRLPRSGSYGAVERPLSPADLAPVIAAMRRLDLVEQVQKSPRNGHAHPADHDDDIATSVDGHGLSRSRESFLRAFRDVHPA